MRPDEILSLYSFNSLRTIARTRGYDLGALRRPELIAALAVRIFDVSELRRVVDALVQGERTALDAVTEAGGRLPREQLAERLLDAGIVDEVGPRRSRETIDRIAPTTRRFEELCARLTAQGLLFSEPHVDGTLAGPYDLGPGAVLFAPGPVLEVARRPAEARTASLTAFPGDQASPNQQLEEAEMHYGRLIVQPSYTVLLLPPLDERTLEKLREIAEPVQHAEVAEFKLTQAALYRAVERGTSVGDVLNFLEVRSEQPLPQNVRYTLEAWSRAFTQVRFSVSAAIVEGSAPILDEIAGHPLLATLVVRRLAHDRLLLKDAAAAEQALFAIGELPGITSYGDQARAIMQVTGDGQIQLDPAAHHLLAALALRRIAEPIGEGMFQLTRQSVTTAAAEAPDGLTGLLKWLRTYAVEVPAELVARLKLWVLPESDIVLEQPLLLRLSPDLLADLRAFPELAPLLEDEYRRDVALVRVAPEARAELVAALKARGLQLPE